MHQTGGLVFKILTIETVTFMFASELFPDRALGPDATFLTAVSLLNNVYANIAQYPQ